jgi:hypothetical protein
MEMRIIPTNVRSGCPELDFVWRRYAGSILERPGVLIADTDEDLNWHAFLGHSIDMQGFRAAEFAGVDALTRPAPGFVPLKQRGVGVAELAALWEVDPIREHILFKAKGTPFLSTLDVLKAHGGEAGQSLVDAFVAFPYRKGHWTVRALLQNSSSLKAHKYSFRRYLQNECLKLGQDRFPPRDFRQPVSQGPSRLPLEMAVRRTLEKAFFHVGPALAAYMLCDWQLWLWAHRQTAVFATFKLDSFQERFVKNYAKGVIPADEAGFVEWWLSRYPDLPPRLANECIWLGVEHNDV